MPSLKNSRVCALGGTLAAKLPLEVLKMAIKSRNTEDLIHHSDKGRKYCSHDYIKLLESRGIKISMSAKGSPYDNAIIESFFRTLKVEEVYLWEYETYRDVVERIPNFIEDVYNSKRLHSSIGYIPPEEFEHKLIKNNSCKVYSELRQVREQDKGLWGITETVAETPKAEGEAGQASQAVVETPKPETDKVEEVYITNTGKKYHRSNCRYLKESKIPISLKEAKSQGYEPCKVCNPPK